LRLAARNHFGSSEVNPCNSSASVHPGIDQAELELTIQATGHARDRWVRC
jgi:hypothetical protein